MKKTLIVAMNEYKRHAFQKRFIFALLSVPVMLAVMAILIYIIVESEKDYTPIGFIDHTGILNTPVTELVRDENTRAVEMIPFLTEEQARAALDSGDIQLYYVLAPNYMQTNQVDLVYNAKIGDNATRQFRDYLKMTLLKGEDPQIAFRAVEGAEVIVRTLDGGREFSGQRWMNVLLPFFAGIGFMILIFSSSGYLMQAVVEEKENRTMEILVTSITSLQLIGGKILGIIAISLTQVIAWALFALIAVVIGGNFFGFDLFNSIQFDLNSILLIIAVLIPAYVMIASLMTAVGAMVTVSSEGQQFAGLFSLPIMMPYWFMALIIEAPNSPFAIGLSLFPLTAPVTITTRTAFAEVPAWQIATSVVLLVLSALAAIWVASRAFRIGLLRYGQRISFREVLNRVH
jgi:ABC-2 type transport system permease protein